MSLRKSFQAFAALVFGVVAEKSRGLLRRVRSRLVRFGVYVKYKAAATCLRKISFAVQMWVARQCIAYREEVPD